MRTPIPGRWTPCNPAILARWINRLRAKASQQTQRLAPPIAELKQVVDSDPVLCANVQAMFVEARRLKSTTPLEWEAEPRDFDEFLSLLNAIMTTAPEAYQDISDGSMEPAGMIGFPINALLNWPMATAFGYNVFSNAIFNQQFKKILGYWATFLASEASRYVLTQNDPQDEAIAWLSAQAQSEMVSVANSALGNGSNPIPTSATFQDIFNCNPDDNYYGFASWDDFFTRTFRPGIRPVSAPNDPSIIVNACESAPLQISTNVKLSDKFWLKGQPYSLENMLNWDDYTSLFNGGTVYQAFLSALSYHRWHAPVSGTIKKAYVVNGTYYLENLYQGFVNPQGADPVAPNNSQAFLTAVATRALIFIEADNPDIGLMCVMPVGMSEVSSCDITVKVGEHVNKGDQLGMFHFGGSTHCLIFRPEVQLAFAQYEQAGVDAPDNIRVNTEIARVTSGK